MKAAWTVVLALLLGVVGAMILAAPLWAADCLRLVGELPEGPSLAVDMEGSLAAFGRGRVLVAADGGFVTVANSDCPWFPGCYPTIELFDVTSPEQPVLTDTLYDASANAIAPSGEFLFIAGGSRQTPGGVVVVDASNPAWMRVVAGLDLVTHPTSIEVDNGVAYVLTDPQLATHAVQLVSLRDPLHPWLIGEHRTPGGARDVALSGNTLLVADGDAGLLLLDATECAFPPPRHPAGRLVPGRAASPAPDSAVAQGTVRLQAAVSPDSKPSAKSRSRGGR